MTDPVILLGTQSNGETLPVQVNQFGQLVAQGLDGAIGPEGPRGPEGPPGPQGDGVPDYAGVEDGWILMIVAGQPTWVPAQDPSSGPLIGPWLQRTYELRGTTRTQLFDTDYIWNENTNDYYAMRDARLIVKYDRTTTVSRFQVGAGDLAPGKIIIFGYKGVEASIVVGSPTFQFYDVPFMAGQTLQPDEEFYTTIRGGDWLDPSGFKINGRLMVDTDAAPGRLAPIVQTAQLPYS